MGENYKSSVTFDTGFACQSKDGKGNQFGAAWSNWSSTSITEVTKEHEIPKSAKSSFTKDKEKAFLNHENSNFRINQNRVWALKWALLLWFTKEYGDET